MTVLCNDTLLSVLSKMYDFLREGNMKLSMVNYLTLFIVVTLAYGDFVYANNAVHHNVGLEHKQRILVLNSYNQGFGWTDNIVRAINDQFKDSPNIVIKIEYMDTKMIHTEDHFERLKELYKYKYAQYPIDVIISSDDDALKFLRKYREELFPGVPVVFCGINDFSKTKVLGFSNYTGVNEKADFKSSFELILKLHPKLKKLYLINNNLTTAKSTKMEFFEALNEFETLNGYEDKFDVEVLADFSLQDLIKKVSSLEKDSIVYYMGFHRDPTGNSFTTEEVIPSISKASPVPVYGTNNSMLGYGIVGGRLQNSYFQGEAAAKAAQKILAGSSAEEIPVIMESPTTFMFDYRQLQRFGIKRSDLPKGSVIINQPGS
jgi:ABC-type uncharacterized transport system substrate-binding protein